MSTPESNASVSSYYLKAFRLEESLPPTNDSTNGKLGPWLQTHGIIPLRCSGDAMSKLQAYK